MLFTVHTSCFLNPSVCLLVDFQNSLLKAGILVKEPVVCIINSLPAEGENDNPTVSHIKTQQCFSSNHKSETDKSFTIDGHILTTAKQ